jgi:predicted membrane-bound spermidine synthase
MILLYAVLPILLFFPPTVLMGLSFGFLQRAVHDDPATSGFKVGVLQAANIAGNVAGSVVTGLVLLDWLGTAGTLRLLVVAGIGFVAVGLRHYGLRPSIAVPGAVLLVLVTAFPGNHAFWSRLHGLDGQPAIFVEDGSGLAGVVPEERQGLRVSINGKGHSNLPFGGIHSDLGAVPALVHPAPERIAIIGLGSADTAWAAGCRPETETLRVFEIVAPVEDVLRALPKAGYPFLESFLADPRVTIEIADGRNALAASDEGYDLIEADALRPHSSYAGNLYSREFFELCARRLRPGGLMCTWAPTRRTFRTFVETFPHVIAFERGEILVGSNDPIPIEPDVWRRRLRVPAVVGYLGPVARSVDRVLTTARTVPARPVEEDQINRDLFPRDEFLTPPVD